jgi:hypothetical protein
MTLIDAIKKYPDISPDILKQYKQAETEIVFNKDVDLHQIHVKLPECPEWHRIANFGKPAKEQKFTPPQLPKKLSLLVSKINVLDGIWEELERNQFFYREEIEFIQKQWYYLLNGYWIFINGKPVYLDGWHFFYCAWWNIDVGIPKYRSRDWKFFHATRFCYTDTHAYYPYRILYNNEYTYHATREIAAKFCKLYSLSPTEIEKGDFLTDVGRRICFGIVYPKYRREGATYKTCCINYCIVFTHKNANGGIQSMTDEDAKRVFLKLTSSWSKLPFFFKPNYEGSTSPKAELSFNVQAKRLSNSGSLANYEIGLESKIDFAIADASGYDGTKEYVLHRDEGGKLKKHDLLQVQSTSRECLSENMGLDIIGLGLVTSTVEEIVSGAAENFKRYCELSRYELRDHNGHTMSGYYVIYIPAEDGIIVDEFGNSIIEDPKPHEIIIDQHGRRIKEGGRSKIINKRKLLIVQGEYEELAKEKRKHNNSYKEVWSTTGQESGLPIGKVLYRIEELSIVNKFLWTGNFQWVDGIFGGKVEFVHDELGKWKLSMILPPSEDSLKYWDQQRQSWTPRNKNKFVLGIDGIKYNVPDGDRKSKGAGAVFYKHDSSVDPTDDFSKWEKSCRFVMTYSHRTFDKDEFHEDMLMSAIYYGCGVFPEYNIPDAGDYFIEKGFGEYLIYRVDKNTNRESSTPGGSFANNSFKEEIFLEYSTHLTRHCQRECHPELLTQVKDIPSPKDMTRFDLFTAGGWALIGVKNMFNNDPPPDDKGSTLDDYYKPRKV